MDAGAVAAQVLVLFLIMMAGLLAKKLNIIREGGDVDIAAFLMNITLPCLGVTSFQRDYNADSLRDIALVVGIGLAIYVVCYFLGMLLSKFQLPPRRKVFWMAIMMSNAGYMGIPVIQAAMGEAGLMHVMSFQLAFQIVMWTLCIAIFSGSKGINIKALLSKPGLIGLVLGLIFFIARVRIPSIPLKALEMLAGLTTPLSMVLVGTQLARVKWRDFTDKSVYLVAAIRLAVIPLVTLLVLKLCGLTGPVLAVEVIIAGMPVAAATSVFASDYHEDDAYASRLVFVSTALSVVTVPLLMLLL